MKDQEVEYAGCYLDQLHFIVLISASPILHSITQECAVLRTEAVMQEPTLSLLAVDG